MLVRSIRPESESLLDMTPMIDTVFNLLIFFLVASSFQQAEREIQIALPFAQSGEPIAAALRELVINVDAEGNMIVTGRKIDADELASIIREAVSANPEQKVTVRGDRSAAYGAVVRVLDLCKAGGIQEPYLDTVLE